MLQDEREEAKSRGSDGTWRVQKDYHIDGGILKEGFRREHSFGTLGPSHWYYPFAHPELAPAVARLAKGGEQAVLEFAHQWGLLGYDRLIPYHPGWFDSDDAGKSVTRTEERRGGDPLSWIWAHAETVRRTLKLIRLLAQCAEAESYAKGRPKAADLEKELDRYLSSLAQQSGAESYANEGGYIHTYESGYIHTHFDLALGIEPIETIPHIRVASGVTVVTLPKDAEWGDPMTPQRMAEEVVSHVLSRNLVGLQPLVLARSRDTSSLQRTFVFPALLSVVYWHLSDAAIGGRVYIQCQRCGKWVLQEHGHQRYCPPQEKGMESLCSLKARQDKWTRSRRQEQHKEEDNGKAQA